MVSDAKGDEETDEDQDRQEHECKKYWNHWENKEWTDEDQDCQEQENKKYQTTEKNKKLTDED